MQYKRQGMQEGIHSAAPHSRARWGGTSKAQQKHVMAQLTQGTADG